MQRPEGEKATGVERVTSKFVRLEHGGLPGTDDDELCVPSLGVWT